MNLQNHHTNVTPTPTLFNIASHNTRSLLDPHTQKLLFDLYSINHLDIIALQETNFSTPSHYFPFKSICNNKFVTYFSAEPDTRRSGFGVGFLVKKYLADHIFHHSSFFNRIFCLDFQFKNKNKFRVINVYLSCSDEPLRLKTIRQMHILIDEAIRANFFIIILGDFNTDPSRPHNPSHSQRFIDNITDNSFVNTVKFVESVTNSEDLHTYVQGFTRTTIDHIFIAPALLSDFNNHQVIPVDLLISDHFIVSASIAFTSINPTFKNASMMKKLVFLYNDISEEDWSTFASATDDRCKKSRLNTIDLENLSNVHKVNFTWDLLQKAIIDAAMKHIPNKHTSHHTKDFRPKLLKSIYKRIKLLHKVERLSRNCLSKGIYDTQWGRLFDKVIQFSKEYDITLPTSTVYSLNFLSLTVSALKDLKHILIAAAKIQETEYKAKAIKEAIERRCENFTTNQSTMFDSLLDRPCTTILLDRYINNNSLEKELLTDPSEVKKETARHFQQVVGSRYSNPPISDSWVEEYAPLEDLDPTIYNPLMQPPTKEEWSNIIKSLPDGKASGPSKILNEMLKHLGPFASKCFWKIACCCLTHNLTPHRWNLAYMYPIPKPKPWEYNLNHTRPITLLECPRKALIKLVNSRLLSILAKHNVLKGNNFAGLPFKSTFELIYILDNIKYDTSFHHHNLWILFQDMSKAYDRVNLGMLIRALLRLHLSMSFVHLIISIFASHFNKIFTAHGDTDAYYVLSGID